MRVAILDWGQVRLCVGDELHSVARCRLGKVLGLVLLWVWVRMGEWVLLGATGSEHGSSMEAGGVVAWLWVVLLHGGRRCVHTGLWGGPGGCEWQSCRGQRGWADV